MLNNATDGAEWVNHAVKLSQILNRNKNTAEGSAVLWDYSYQNFIQPNVKRGESLTISNGTAVICGTSG